MDKKELLGGHFKKEIKAQRRLDEAKQREFERSTNEQVETEERRRPFRVLLERRRSVLREVRALTEEGALHDEFSHESRKKIIVVIDKHPKTDRTPDHTAVCGVTYIDRTYGSRSWPRGATVEFAFAIVPNDSLAGVINYPHTLHDPRDSRKVLFDPEEMISEGRIMDNMDTKIRIFRGFMLHRLGNELQTAENNLAMVQEAIANPELNPHLRTPAEVA